MECMEEDPRCWHVSRDFFGLGSFYFFGFHVFAMQGFNAMGALLVRVENI